MRICVVAGMIDAKLHSKIEPLQNSTEVSEILLVRRKTYAGDKIVLYKPPDILVHSLLTAEIWRFCALIYIGIFKRPTVFIAFGTVPHGIYVWLIGKLLCIPVVQHVMGKNDLRLGLPDQYGQGLCLNAVIKSDLVAVRGDRMKSWFLEKGLLERKIFKPQNIHDFSLFSPDDTIVKTHDLIYVGLLAPYKRVDVILRSFSTLCTQRPNSTLLIVGDGPLRKDLQKLAESLSIADKVTFTGAKDYFELPDLYRLARVFVMTSLGDGLPMAMIEAMSCGLPAIVPNDADILEVAVNNVNALIVDTPTDIGYYGAIERLIDDEVLYRELQGGALQIREQYKKEYSLEFQTTLWTNALQTIRH